MVLILLRVMDTIFMTRNLGHVAVLDHEIHYHDLKFQPEGRFGS